MTRSATHRLLAAALLAAAPTLAASDTARAAVAAKPSTASTSARDSLRPLLECVVQNGPTSFTAHFGYENDGAAPVDVPAGPRNALAPAPAERGQPTSFAPGRTRRFPASAFKVDFDGRELTWTLVGADGRARTATASASSRRCSTTADALAPRLFVREPRKDSFLATRQARFELSYEDDGVLDLASLQVTIDGEDRTSWFRVGPRGATAEHALEDGRHRLEIRIRDDSGRTGTLSQSFTIDTQPPRLSVLQPLEGAFVSGTSVDVGGGIVDATPVRVTVGASDAAVKGHAFEARRVPLGAGPEIQLPLVARDAAGNTSTASLRLRVEQRPPVVKIDAPLAGAEVRGPSLTVSGTVRGADVASAKAAPAPAVAVEVNGRAASIDGGKFRVELLVSSGRFELRAVARSAAGLSATDAVTVRVDTEPPALVVEAPLPDSATSARSIRVTGRTSDPKATVRVNGTLALVTDGAFSATVALPREGQQMLLAVAEDPAGNRSEVEVPILVDRTAPELSLLSLPEDAPVDGRSLSVAGSISDAGAVSVTVDGQPAELLEHGWRADLSGLSPGTHVLEAVARDEAGNETRVMRDVTVAEPEGQTVVAATGGPLLQTTAATMGPLAMAAQSLAATATSGEGAVVGQVLSDVTGLPIADATVHLEPGAQNATTDAQGRYSFATAAGPVVLVVEKAGLTRVQREVTVEAGLGTVAVDARLTPLAAAVPIGAAGGTLTASFPRRLRPDGSTPAPPAALTVTIPPGAVSAAGSYRLTALGSQGLPGLLPLGFSPIVALQLDGGTAPAAIQAHVTGLPSLVLHLVAWDLDDHAWKLVASPPAPAGGTLDVALPGLGGFALVAVDPGAQAPPLPAIGQPLEPAAFVAIPEGAVGRSFADPPSLPASGGTSRGRIEVDSPQALPSGTVVQAVLTESFRLVTGESATEDERLEDILLFRADLDGLVLPEAGAASLAAEIPIVPSRQHTAAELEEGRISLRVLAGREGVRSAGGSNAVSVSSGGASLEIPAGALPADTAVSFTRATSPSSFLPQPPGLTAVAEFKVDLTGAQLALAAALRMPAAGVPPGGSLFVARAEQVGGETRLQVVAWAERQGADVVTVARVPLPGLRKGGRYVLYHAAGPVGFLTGTTRAGTQPRPALVTTTQLPFVGISGTDGVYSVLTQAGSVRATARVLGTSLTGSAETDIAAGSVRSLDIVVTQAVTLALVTPASGTTGFPVTRQIELHASAPLDPLTVTAASVKLRRTSDGAQQALRTVLSADARHVAVIPLAPLAYQTAHTFESTGILKDAYGSPVAVPVVEFTTEAQSSQALDLDALVFSYPVDGMVTMRAPAGALPSGTQILVLNASVGSALTYTVGALPIQAELRASIADRLWVTVTDPQGKVTTIERTEYVAPDGKTAVGVAGGKVRGPDGSEMRLPAGSTDGPVTIKLESFPETALPQGLKPDVPGAHFGYGLSIESADKPRFNKEVDLAFPRPAGAPEGAFFYIYRTIELPGGRVSFETIDQAFDEGGKVVTASYPFGGYQTSFGVLGGGYGAAQLIGQSINHAILMWSFEQLLPGRAAAGVITGQVLRAGIDPQTGAFSYTPIRDAIVTGVNAAGTSLLQDPSTNGISTALSQVDGTFSMIDARYTGGLVAIAATTPQAETKTVSAYQSNPLEAQNYGLRFFTNIARVTFTFDPLAPPQGPPVIELSLVRLGALGQRLPADSLIVENSHLLVGIRRKNAVVEQVSIGGVGHAFEDDAAPATEPLRFDVVTRDEFVASPPGMYRVEVVARDQAGNPHTVSQNFRVVPLGGGNELPAPGAPPEVLDARTFPDRGARNVQVSALPQVEFSEPVKNVPGHVSLVEIDSIGNETPVSIRLLGIVPGLETPIDVTPASQADQPIVSLIVSAQPGLRFGKRYRLDLTSAIVDFDPAGDGGPRSLVPYSTEFTTATLAPATSREDFPSPGIVTQDGFTYVVENEFERGTLKVYDVRDPSRPEPVPQAERPIENRPVDLAAKPKRLVVGTTVPARSVPSNLHVFNIERPDDPQWVGAASVASGVLDGTLRRVVVHGGYAYALVFRKGVQVVDLKRAEANVAATGGPAQAAYWNMRRALNTDGQGFGMDAIVSNIPLPAAGPAQWYPHDLDVGDYVLGNSPQPLVVIGADDRVAQTCSLLVGSPIAAQLVSRTRLHSVANEDLCPELVAVGRVAGRDVAVLGVGYASVSYQATRYGLAVVDMADPLNPQLLGLTPLALPELSDLVLDGETALVSSASGGTEVVSLGTPDRPYSAGHIDNLSGRLSVGPKGTYLSSGGTYASVPEGGLHVAGGSQCDLLDLRDDSLMLEVVRDPVDATLCGGGDVLVFNVCEASRVTLRIDGLPAPSLNVDGVQARLEELPLGPGRHVVDIPFGTIGTGLDTVKAFTLGARSEADASVVAERQGTIQNKLLNRPVLPLGRTFVKGVDLFDGHVVRQATDIKVQGRHLGLELTRTYSSAARGEDGPVGAGWGWNYDAAVSPMSCGLYNVSTPDGGGQVFRSSDAGQSFTPQMGYHGKLNRLPDKGYEYVDKAGVKHYFREPVDPTQPEGAKRLERIVEPHGDRVELAYNLAGHVSSVREVLRGERPVRSLDARYVRVYGHERLASVESSLGHRVEYGYDAKGNLTSVKRSGQNVDGKPDAEPATELYEYSTTSTRDQHQMTAAVGPNGDRTEYSYYTDADTIPGSGVALSWIISSKQELTKQVKELANVGPAPEPQTSFSYDFTQGPSSVYTTTVKDPRGNDSVYTLNPHGSPTRILEPLGKETLITWKPNDILKESERDALGRLTSYGYDARGNLTLERIEKNSVVLAETAYQYDPQFNKLSYKKDAEGRETTHTIDSTTGDLLATVDALANRTEFHYDGDGQLDWTKDPRGFTTHFQAFNDFGSPREVRNPLGQLTTRVYDSRNRVVEERDEPYKRLAQTVYDGFDRPVERVRISGGPASSDERTLMEYYPGGQPRATTNALGARTTYTLDGLNRVVRTSVPVEADTLTTETQYDGNGNTAWEKDRRGVTRRSTYDPLNRLTKVEIETAPGGEGPLGQVAAYGYDLAGNKTSDTDVNGFVTEYRYDGLYHIERKVLPLLKPSSPDHYEELYRADKVGNVTRVTDANGHVTETEYDKLNRVTKVTRDPGALPHLNLVSTASYDDPGGSHVNKSEERDLARGLKTSFAYDPLNRETTRTVSLEGEDGDASTSIVTYTTTAAYVDVDHAVRVTDPRGVVALRKLDGLDRVVEETVDTDGLAPATPLSLITSVLYDGLSNKKEVTDPEGRTTSFDYDALGRLLKTTDAKSQETTVTYYGDGLKASETDRRGVTRLFTYDGLGRPRKTRLESAPFTLVPWSHETRYADGTLPKRIEIDARGKETTFHLDGLGRVIKEADSATQFRTFKWDGVNKIAETDKRLQHYETLFEYDAINRLKKTQDPAPFADQTVETTYDDANNRVTIKDRRGFLTRTQTDPLGRVVSVTRAFGTPDQAVLETNQYDGNGNKTLVTDAEGKKTRFEYDAANRLAAREDGFQSPDAAITTFVHDKAGNVLEERDARAAALALPWSVKRSYDELNRVETETDGESNVTHHSYDAEGNRTSVQAPKGQTTQFDYDELGKLTKVTQPGALVTSYVYDPNRNRTHQTDANGHVVVMEYDEQNRLKKVTQDLGGLNLVTQTTEFDENSNPLLTVDPKGQTTTNTYDELNRLKTQSYAFAPSDTHRPWRYTASVDYAYDKNGNLKQTDEHVESGTSPQTTLTNTRVYDGLDRLKSETQPLPNGGSKTLEYTYFKNGTRETVKDPADHVTRYVYDGQNRVKTATTDSTSALPKTTTYTYEPDDLLKTVSYPNGVVATHTYDKADRLLSIVNAKSGVTLSSYQYTGIHPVSHLPVSYDPNGNRLIQIETNGGKTETTTYTYDGLDRLETVRYPIDASYPKGRVVSYGYDAVGNRVRETEKDSTNAILADKQGIFDNANRLTELQDLVSPANTTTFTWDANGNQLTKTTAGATTENRYDLRDKLIEVAQGPSTLARFQYDAEGRRNLKIGEGMPGDTLRQYVYDQTSLLTEYDAGGLQKAKYDYGSDRLISLTRTDEGRRYFSLDGLRSVVNLTDDNGLEVASYHLDAWGNFRFPTELNDSKNRFAFTGHIWDEETGLYNAKARYFDPKLGRFLTQDSFLGEIDEPPSLHRYLYANANPTTFFDPTGHIARQILDQSINKSTDQASNWFTAGVTAFFKEASYQTLDVISFGALHRQDKLVDQNLAGEISDTDYHSKTAWNVALSSGQAAMTLGTGGTLGATRGAAVAWGAASGIAGQGISDIGEIYATETKTLDQVRATDYLLAGGMGAVGGYAGYKARGPAKAPPSQAEKTGIIAEQGQSVRPQAPEPAAGAAATADVNVQPALNRRYAVGERMPDGRLAGDGPGAAAAHEGAFTPTPEESLSSRQMTREEWKQYSRETRARTNLEQELRAAGSDAPLSLRRPDASRRSVGQQQGREFRVDWLEVFEFDPKMPRHVKGWLAQERRLVEAGRRATPRTPRGYVMAHGRTTPAREGFDYSNATLQNEGLNTLEEMTRRQAGRQ